MVFFKRNLFVSIFPLFAVTLITTELFVDNPVEPRIFYFFFSSGLLLFNFILFLLFKKTSEEIRFNFADIFLILYLLYITLRLYYTSSNNFGDPVYHVYLLMTCLYFLFKKIANKDANYERSRIKILFAFLTVFAIIEMTHGYLQLFGIVENSIKYFKIGGSYGNSGSFANYLVSVSGILLGFFLLFHPKSLFEKRLRLAYGFFFALIILLLPFTNSRTSWITSIFIILCMFCVKYKTVILEILKKPIQRYAIILTLVLLGFFVGKFLIEYKTDSSYGRIVIWKTTLNIIKDYPLWGSGFNTFLTTHNDYQALYYSMPGVSEYEKQLADNVNHAFNDLLELTSENGLIGLLLFLGFVSSLLVEKKNEGENIETIKMKSILKISISAILLSAMTSYPLHELPVMLNFFLFCGLLSGLNTNRIFTIQLGKRTLRYIGVILMVLLFWFEYVQIKRAKSNLEWNKAVVLIRKNQTNEALRIYSEIYPTMRYSGLFLYNYGAELSSIDAYQESLKILNETEKKFNDADFYTYLGNTYEGLNDLKNAEIAFVKASQMVPHLIYPQYRLVYIYQKTDRKEKALNLANQLIHKDPKIINPVDDFVKTELMKFVRENNKNVN